ncbi:MAG: hypothetical protein HWD59_01620 [Coxiellaceae bacterium]|nr:MAG: hypothetical protein HWD59_01620 [Coxiellaceae bacterium]
MTRKLGYWETIKTLMHDLFAGNDITVIALHFKGMIQSGLCKRALQLSFERHPLLRATIHQDNTDGYQFQLNVDFAAIPFTIIQQTYPEQSISLIEAEMKSLFPKEKYLWRVTLLENTPKQECYLLLTFHHAISDATAIFYFIHETLTAYSALEKQGTQFNSSPDC